MRTTALYVVFVVVLTALATSPANAKTLYYDNFDGLPGVELNGTTPDITMDGAAWEAGSAVAADGTLGSLFTAVLPFVPSTGTVYELSATFENEGDWAAIGFLTEPTNLDTRILDNGVLLWSLAREPGSANFDQAFVGPGTTDALGDATVSSAAELKVRLETTSETEWLVSWFFDGVQEFQQTVNPATLEINYVAFGVNGMFNPASGTISSFRLVEVTGPPTQASEPNPDDEATDVHLDAILSWSPGESAATHDVYFGTVFDDVNDADRADPMGVLVSQDQAETTYIPETPLELGQTYYWRVDEVNAAPDNTIFKGQVWRFTAEPVAYPIAGIVATSNASSSAGMGPEKTVDGSGLNENDEHSTVPADMWLGVPGAEPVYLRYEFDRVYKLHEMLVWNYNVIFEPSLGFGLKDVTVEYSADGAEWTTLGDVIFAQATARPDYVANTRIDLGGVAAQQVRLTINSAHGTAGQYGLSEVRFLYIPAHAREPEPADGATRVDVNTVLDWRLGRDALSHNVYLSTDANAVADGTAPVETISETPYVPSPLDFGSTYYWRVDEIQDVESWEGDTWSFSTQEYAVIDDMESYTDDEGGRIYETWVDGYGIDENGSQVGYLGAPFTERTIVNSGAQSMPLHYGNTGTANISEAEMDLAGMDLSANGAENLRLFVYGMAPAFQDDDGSILMNGIGEDIWGAADQFRFAYKQLTGNGSMIVRVDDLDASPNGWAKAGVMIRQGLQPGAVNAFMAMTGGEGGGATFQQRLDASIDTVSQHTFDGGPFALPYWVRIDRAGDAFSAFISPDGQNWTQAAETVTIEMDDSVQIGLALTSHNANQGTSAAFSQVGFTGGVSGDWEMAEIGATQPVGNDPQLIYVALDGVAVIHPADPPITAWSGWTEWVIPLSAFGDVSNVRAITIGIGDPDDGATAAGLVFIDDVGYGRPAPGQ